MTQLSIPFNGTTTGDAGPYGAEDWSGMYARMIGFDADEDNAGVMRGIEEELEVVADSPASSQIVVGTGSALLQGKYYRNDADVNFTITANGSGNDRIDAVVLRIDYVAQTVRLVVKEGTPAASPSRPSMTQSAGTLWEIPLAFIAVANGFVTITDTNITDVRRWSNIPDGQKLPIINQSASQLEKGNVVVQDGTLTGPPIEANTSTTGGDETVMGIIESTTLSGGGAGFMITRGITPVICDENVSAGDYLEQSTTAGQAQKWDNYNRPFGLVLAANSGAGTACIAYVDFSVWNGKSGVNHASILYTNVSNYTTNSTSFGDVDAANAIVTITTKGGGNVYVSFNPGEVGVGVGNTYFDIYDVTNATRLGNTNGLGIAAQASNAAYHHSVNIFGVVSGLAAGTHSFKLQWRVGTSGGTIYATAAGAPIAGIAMEL